MDIYFWSDEKYRFLSNFYMRPQECRGVVWPSNEHFFQGMKTDDATWRERVRNCINAGKAKQLGKKVPLIPNWDTVKFDIMREGLRAKFSHPDLRASLIATGEADLYEDSPYDKIWGTGTLMGRGPGKNLMGALLVELRKELIAQSQSPTATSQTQ
jgi:ribA/ribD-fused uncharacterized protein